MVPLVVIIPKTYISHLSATIDGAIDGRAARDFDKGIAHTA